MEMIPPNIFVLRRAPPRAKCFLSPQIRSNYFCATSWRSHGRHGRAHRGRGLAQPPELFSFDFYIHWRLGAEYCVYQCTSMYKLKKSGAGIPRQNLNFHLIDRRAPCRDTRAVDGGNFWSNHPSWIMIQYSSSSSECVCSWDHIRVTQGVVSHSSRVTRPLLEHKNSNMTRPQRIVWLMSENAEEEIARLATAKWQMHNTFNGQRILDKGLPLLSVWKLRGATSGEWP